jgi:predicted regulator of Ras-like GTPase activity (Roadblock/LC7/MglB family)
LNCLGRQTLALKIVQEDEIGYIYFDEGNIVHSATNNFEGENAFYYILSWQGGEFSIYRNQRAPLETINKGWQSLLLEALRRVDENSGISSRGKEQEKQQRILNMHQILNPLLKVKGIELILVHNSAGFPITFLPENFQRIDEIEEIGNQISMIYKDIEKKENISKSSSPSFLEIHFKNKLLISRRDIESDTIVSVLLYPRTNLGLLRLELPKRIDKIIKVL